VCARRVAVVLQLAHCSELVVEPGRALGQDFRALRRDRLPVEEVFKNAQQVCGGLKFVALRFDVPDETYDRTDQLTVLPAQYGQGVARRYDALAYTVYYAGSRNRRVPVAEGAAVS